MTRLHRAAMAVLWVGALGVILLLIVGLTNKVNRADHRAAQSVAQTRDAVAAVANLAQQVRSLGGQPVVTPSQLPKPGATGATGPMGPTGPPPSNAQVAEAVTLYCTTHRCTGRDGRDGKDGLTGAPGSSGAKGDTGPAGKNGTDGANGTNGAAGKDGRGITSITCAGPPMETFTFVYTDGTIDTVTCTAGGDNG